jgi:hypothetical protein
MAGKGFSSEIYEQRQRDREAARERNDLERDSITDRTVQEGRHPTAAEESRLAELARERERLGEQETRDNRERYGTLTGEEIDRINELQGRADAGEMLTPAEQQELGELKGILDATSSDPPGPPKPPFDPPGPDSMGRMIAGGPNSGDNGSGDNGSGDQGSAPGQGDTPEGGPEGGPVAARADDGDVVAGTRRVGSLGHSPAHLTLSEAARLRLGHVLDHADAVAPGITSGDPATPSHVVGDPGPDQPGVRGPSPEERDRFRRPGSDPRFTDPPDDDDL